MIFKKGEGGGDMVKIKGAPHLKLYFYYTMKTI